MQFARAGKVWWIRSFWCCLRLRPCLMAAQLLMLLAFEAWNQISSFQKFQTFRGSQRDGLPSFIRVTWVETKVSSFQEFKLLECWDHEREEEEGLVSGLLAPAEPRSHCSLRMWPKGRQRGQPGDLQTLHSARGNDWMLASVLETLVSSKPIVAQSRCSYLKIEWVNEWKHFWMVLKADIQRVGVENRRCSCY